MKRVFLLTLFLLVWVAPLLGATRYVKTSCNNGATTFDPETQACTGGSDTVYNTVANCLAWVTAGNGCGLADGTYTGASNMIDPTDNLSGTATNRITVFAMNDGAATINGQGARIPIRLVGNNYWTIEGVNAANSSEGVIMNTGFSSHNIVRRVVAWNANDNDSAGNPVTPQVWYHSSGSNNLWEDVAGFGTGRYIYITYGPNTHAVTIRRAWGAWQHSLHTSPKNVFGLDYSVHQPGTTCENCIGTWITTQTGISQPSSVFRIIGGDPGELGDTDTQYLGSIAYFPITKSYKLPALTNVTTSTIVTFKDVVFYNERSDMRNVRLQNPDGTLEPNDCITCALTNITEIGGDQAANQVESQWVQTNRRAYANIAAMNAASANPFQATSGNGARVCFRYENRLLTSTPLWPWPMNQRIIDAMIAAGKPPVDVTKTMEQIFGPIPVKCRSDSVGPVQLNSPTSLVITK